MKRVLAAFVFVLCLASLSFAAEKRIVFINSSDEQIKGIFLAPAGTPTVGPGWGKNLLKKWKLKPGRSVNVAVPHDQGNCKWDMKYVVREKMAYTIKDVDICKAVEIELFLKGDQAWANIK